MTVPFANRLDIALLGISLSGLGGGLVAMVAGRMTLADAVWTAGVLPVLLALAVEILRSLRAGNVGLDIVAALSMTAALTFGETLAAAVVAVMYSGGTFLEGFAAGRARREMRALLSRVPRSATRHRDGALEEIPIEEIVPGDMLLLRRGEIAPVDGEVARGEALMDQSALTGEAMPVRHAAGDEVMSGSSNLGEAFDLRASRNASESTYAGIVRLVEAAQRSRAPMTRLADRYSLLFLAVTVALAAGAWWATQDPIRAVAVLVVATPCPLILAVPVALVAGLSRAARFGVLIKGAAPLEALSRVRTVVLDKTGTLTLGRPAITAIEPAKGWREDEVLRLAAGLEQATRHPVAAAIVSEAQARGLALPVPEAVSDSPGEGLAGTVEGRAVLIGGAGFVARHLGDAWPGAAADAQSAGGTPGSLKVVLAVDGATAGRLILRDALREGTRELLDGLRRNGVARIVLATGDRREVAEEVTRTLGFDAIMAELTPAQKVEAVARAHETGPVMMVGDGVNDAPALAAADVGVAMGARGAAASAEAADVVLLVDRLDRLLPGLEVARGARRIAMQSVVAGIGLSVAGMIAAAFGLLSPVEGAILQEVIDVAVILNALRALRIAPSSVAASDPLEMESAREAA